eukprot:COSAG05_NODE_1387_length_5007_cov_322.307253_5_plen_340_part_00
MGITDIEDLDGACQNYRTPPPKGTAAGRLYRMSGHVNRHRKLGTLSENCLTCVAKCDAAAAPVAMAAEPEVTSVSEVDAKWAKGTNGVFPVTDPYGHAVSLEDLVNLRATEPGATSSPNVGETAHDLEQLGAYNAAKRAAEAHIKETGELPEDAQGMYSGASGARRKKSGSALLNPHTTTPAVNAAMLPILQQFVANVKTPKNANVADSPTVRNGHVTYADPARFTAEQAVLFKEGLLVVGLSMDLANNHDFKRFEVAGKRCEVWLCPLDCPLYHVCGCETTNGADMQCSTNPRWRWNLSRVRKCLPPPGDGAGPPREPHRKQAPSRLPVPCVGVWLGR